MRYQSEIRWESVTQRLEQPYVGPPAAGSGRREFLRKTLAGAVVLGSAAFLARCTADEPGPADGMLVLSARELKTLQNFCQAVLPASPAAGAPTDSSADPVLATPYRIDREISQWTPKNRAQMRSVLALVEDGTRYFLFSWRRFGELSAQERRAYLHGWARSEFRLRRTSYQALRMMCLFYYYSQDSTWKAIGYDGPWIKREL
jgi:hypothetical protein